MGRKPAGALLAALALAGCGARDRLVVGSKNFTEQLVLGEILAQHVERRLGIPVDRKLNLQGTLIAHTALTAGQIDLYPEYAGTALAAVLKEEPPRNARAVYERVRDEYRRRFAVEWLEPLGIDNSFALAVRGGDARARSLRTLSDAAALKGFWRLGIGSEFLDRRDGLPALAPYGFQWAGAPRTMDLGLLYAALEQNRVNIVAGSATDGLLAARDFVVLADDRRVFPAYEVCVAVRGAALAKHPGLRGALAELSGRITNAEMRKMNLAVDGGRRDPRDVAREFLAGLADSGGR
jgi:glycine betaine/choline ABC-type transport system substrate-binding protein